MIVSTVIPHTRDHRIAPVLLAAVTSVLSGCCEEPKAPCLTWLKDGATYRVELVKSFRLNDGSNVDTPYPYSGYSSPELSCGELSDLNVGQRIEVKSLGRMAGDESERCRNGCYDVMLEPTIPGVEHGKNRGPGSYGNELFSGGFEAVIGGECHAAYTIGISPVSGYFINNSAQWVPTDYMIYRMISTPNPEACVVPGSQILERSGCWDSWSVRIWDSEGKLITKDLPPKMIDAGANMGIANDEDGGM